MNNEYSIKMKLFCLSPVFYLTRYILKKHFDYFVGINRKYQYNEETTFDLIFQQREDVN